MKPARNVVVVKQTGAFLFRIVRRFRALSQAEGWIARLKSKRAQQDRHDGLYSIDAPERKRK